MADANSSITVNSLDITIDKAFDVTMAHGRPGGVVIHLNTSRIILSAEVLADIDQARAEAATDRAADMTKDGS